MMRGVNAKLILINGIPASGKTTLARAWCERHAAQLPFALDIDSIRSMLGGWRNALLDAGLAAREIAIAAMVAHLDSGRDVVIPQYLRRDEFIDRLEDVAHARGASFVETALMIDASTAESRFRARAEFAGGTDPHGTLHAEMASISEDFDVFLRSRPRVVRIESGTTALNLLESAVSDVRPAASR